MFSGDESASFLSLAHKIRVEAQLAADNISDATLAQQHAKNAAGALDNDTVEEIVERNQRIANDLPLLLENLETEVSSTPIDEESVNQIVFDLDAILGEAVSVRIEREQLGNSRVQALVLANLTDDVLRNYGEAYDVGFDMTDMSLMAQMMEGDDHSSMQMDGNNQLVDMSAYQSALAFANKSLDVFRNDLKPLGPEGDAVAKVESSLVELRFAVNNKAQPMDVMMIVHTKVHPNMITAYNLQMAGQEPAGQTFAVSYTLDGETYSVNGKSAAKATSMSINPNTSVVIQFDQPAEVELTLPRNMIDDVTTVMAGEQELEFDFVTTADSSTTIRFTLPEGSDSVEIMGAMVVPEFSTIAALVLAVSLIATIAFVRMKQGSGLERFGSR
jgi:predicted secreted protein with PEFG-CTERM motif